MVLHSAQIEGIGILIAEGRVGREDVAHLDAELDRLVEKEAHHIAISIKEITYFSRLAAESIRRRRWILEQAGGDLFLIGDNETVFDQLRRNGVWTTFQTRIFPDFETLAARTLKAKGLDVEEPSDHRFLTVASTFESSGISGYN